MSTGAIVAVVIGVTGAIVAQVCFFCNKEGVSMKVFLRNLKSFHHRIMMRYLRKRGWVVFYLEKRARTCNGGTCWLKLYEAETK